MNSPMQIRSKDQLVEYVNHGNRAKYVFFWGHQKPKSGVSKSCFSQWYESPFEENGILYQTAEHYMMAAKARLFCDDQSEAKVIAASNPGEAKKVGRSVVGFNEDVWCENRFEIVVQANLLKFEQNRDIGDFLRGTGERVLVEASPVDKVWGIGMATDNAAVDNPNLWKGLNLLGFALMEVRDRLSR